MNKLENQAKYGLIKEVNFTIILLKNSQKIMILKCIRYITKEKLLLLKHMTSISKNVYIDKLDVIVIEFNNTYHRTIKMKPVDVKGNAQIDSSKEVNDKDPKCKVGDHGRISKYKNVFAKGYTPNRSEEVFVTEEVKNTVP